MKFVNVIAAAVIISVMAAQLQATPTTPTAPTGFGFELLQTQLEAFESRMQKQFDGIQLYIKLNRIELEHIKKTTAESLMNKDSGVYFVNLNPSANASFAVYRDGSNNHGFGSNWTVFQRRFDGTVDFNRNWTEYRNGFGNLHREHWLGLEKLRKLLDTERHELLIVMKDFEGVTAFAKYDNFKIGTESEMYALKSLGTYSGIAGDSFSTQLNHKFATADQDTAGKCADTFQSGTWFSSCYQSNLNGVYLKGGKQTANKGLHWYFFRGYYYSLKATKMMVRPYAYRSVT
uniref:Fibrinogen C-terminal domain-containing protein n=1 Tax=Anopheles stephensi TaxID=30069 RepID=A0A182YF72_ANOST